MSGKASVSLRRHRKNDLSVLAALRCDVKLQHTLLAYPPRRAPSADETRGWIARRLDEPGGCFLVVADPRDHAIGFVQVTDVHRRGRFGKIGIALTADARGKGYGREALDRLLRHACETLKLRKILLEVRADNALAIALFKSSGFRRVGTLRAHYDDGAARHDVVLMERTP